MKNNKSPGSDEAIITEALKYSGDSLHAGSNKRSPKPKRDFKQCCENIIIPISKKASKHMKDFKGMNLMSIAGKVYNKMQLNSIYEPTNILRPFQAGFSKGRNCLEQIHILKRLLKAECQRQLPLLITFVLFSKAFVSVETLYLKY